METQKCQRPRDKTKYENDFNQIMYWEIHEHIMLCYFPCGTIKFH